LPGPGPRVDEILKRGTRDEQVTALCALARELLAKDDTTGALTVMDRAVRLDGRSPAAWSIRGDVLAKRNRAGEALGSFDRALAADPKFPAAVVGKADLLLKIGSHAEAIECYEAAVAVFPEAAHLWVNRAKAFEGANRYEDAIESIDRALALSDAPAMWVLRGDIQAKAGRDDEAKVSYERAVIIDPSSTNAWFQLAMTASKTRDVDAARRACDRFLDLTSADDPRIASVRSLLFQLDRHGANGKSVDARRPRRRSSSRMRRISSRALEAVRPEAQEPPPAIEEPGGEDDFEATLADLIAADRLHREGQNVEALRKLEKLVKEAPAEIHAWVLRARVLLSLDKADLALASAEKAIALDAASLSAWKVMTRGYLVTRKLERAIDAALRAENVAPRDPEVHRLRGECLVEANRHTEAAIAFEKAVLYAPTDADGWLALGRVLRLLRRSGAARDALEKARDLAESNARPEVATEARVLLERLG
jgi:tetratricopeptide (TPR) repeat protein